MSPNAEVPNPHLSLQEAVLATSMARRIGTLATSLTFRKNGYTYHSVPEIDNLDDHPNFIDTYRSDPKECLAFAREELIAIGADTRLQPAEREKRLGRYLDAYFDLTVKLDRKAYPSRSFDGVKSGVPLYIPDGFNDMGREHGLDLSRRNREMIHVDKSAILKRFKPDLIQLFSSNFSHASSTQKKEKMASFLAQKVYFGVMYNSQVGNTASGRVDLAKMSEGVCRHQALVYQVLAQACGLTTRLAKGRLIIDDGNSERHAANMVRINHQWYIVDPTNSDYKTSDGIKTWAVGGIKIDRPPKEGESRSYVGVQKHSGRKFQYDLDDRMFWTIDRTTV